MATTARPDFARIGSVFRDTTIKLAGAAANTA